MTNRQVWSLQSLSGSFNGVTYESPYEIADFRTGFDYIGVFEDLYNVVVANLEEREFVCFNQDYPTTYSCVNSRPCASFYYSLHDLTIDMTTNLTATGESKNVSMTLESRDYLITTSDNQCVSTIVKIPDGHA